MKKSHSFSSNEAKWEQFVKDISEKLLKKAEEFQIDKTKFD